MAGEGQEVINPPIQKASEKNKGLTKTAEEPAKTKAAEKQPIIDRVHRKVFSPERATEFFSAQIMMGIEIVHDMQLYPEKYSLEPNQVGKFLVPEASPAAKWAMDHIGDIWEISAGFTAMRLGFVAANEVLKKTTGKEIPDEACFWASLATTVTVKAAHSLGYISLFGIHDHMANPVPEMIFGQAVAAVVLAASHYAAKYGRGAIKDLTLRAAKKLVEVGRGETLVKPTITPNIAVSAAKGREVP